MLNFVWGFLKLLFGATDVTVKPYAEPSSGPRVPPPLQSASGQIPVMPAMQKQATVDLPTTPVDKAFAWQAFARRGEKIMAIKAYREAYGGDLATAKNAVEAYVGADPFQRPAAPIAKPTQANLEQQLDDAIDRGALIEAIKLYRLRTGASLVDAKNWVETQQRARGQR